MDRETLRYAISMVVTVAGIASVALIALGTRFLWRLGERKRSRLETPADDRRMDRLEAAVDAIAIEVERISEGQRFTMSMLADRLPQRVDRVAELPSVGPAKRINTPH
jgi:hypothetical protein